MHTAVLVPTCIVIFQRCPRLTLQDSPKCGARTHFLSILSCLSLAYICGLGLCPFNELVCDLLPRQLFHGSQKEYLIHNLDEHCLEETRSTWSLSYPSGGAPEMNLFIRIKPEGKTFWSPGWAPFPGRYVFWPGS